MKFEKSSTIVQCLSYKDRIIITRINYCFYRAEYLSEFDAVHIVFKGKVKVDQIIKLRNILGGLSESLKIEKLILDFSESEHAFIDYNSHSRIVFWQNLVNHGLKMFLLIITPANFTEKAHSWKSFYADNKLTIGYRPFQIKS